MSLLQSPTVERSSSPIAGHDYRVSSKRKLDDCADDEDPDLTALVSVRMRRDEFLAATVRSSSNQNQNQNQSSSSSNHLDMCFSSDAKSSVPSTASFSSSHMGSTRSATSLQFFVRMISDGHIVIQANSRDSVRSVHERIQTITGIPVMEQRLIYRGKQLQCEQSLAECLVENDAVLQLVGRMRSTQHPRACQLLNEMVAYIFRLCKLGSQCRANAQKYVVFLVREFFTLTPKDNEALTGHLEIFMSSSAPAALVMLYLSAIKGNKQCADCSIKHILNLAKNSFPKLLQAHCAPIVLEFCKLLRKVSHEDPLYLSCRSTLGSLLENVGSLHGSSRYGVVEEVKGLIEIPEIFPFVTELASSLSKDLASMVESPLSVGPLLSNIRDFSAFLLPFHTMATEQMGFQGPISVPLNKKGISHPLYAEEIKKLHFIFDDLLITMDKCLCALENCLPLKSNGEGESTASLTDDTGYTHYLSILKELSSIAKLYKDAEDRFWAVLRLRKASLRALIVRYAKQPDDHEWLFQHKDVTDFESRRHLAMIMFSDLKEDLEDLHEMLIDRSQLLAESFEYIARAEPDALRTGLFMEFKNEQATGPGVLREWFFLVAQAIFNPENALFIACPNDRRRFYPNPASKVDPMHLDYFTFSGRVIALSLMHKVQVGIVFDSVFFLQLAGRHISLEDIQDADPYLYSSCKKILEMDAEFIDSDALGLTFVREVEELGSRKIVELCPGGKNIVVDSKNREEYVNLHIQHRFVTSIAQQVSHFAQGFADILSNTMLQKSFFQCLELQDLDLMLYGSESAICVEDWKAHTEYNGYKETDLEISWFWKIVGEMSAEKRKVLLFFWTSVKYLPVEGFRGLASKLCIYKSSEPFDRLPSSRTCFYQLCFPPYPSMNVMQDRLCVITQEHVGCSFGTW